MQCPLQIAEILADILTTGLLRIRALGWNQHPERCAIEADHLHNLPALLTEFKPELLDHYWNACRIDFIRQSSQDDLSSFEPLWKALGDHVASGQQAVVPGRR